SGISGHRNLHYAPVPGGAAPVRPPGARGAGRRGTGAPGLESLPGGSEKVRRPPDPAFAALFLRAGDSHPRLETAAGGSAPASPVAARAPGTASVPGAAVLAPGGVGSVLGVQG